GICAAVWQLWIAHKQAVGLIVQCLSARTRVLDASEDGTARLFEMDGVRTCAVGGLRNRNYQALLSNPIGKRNGFMTVKKSFEPKNMSGAINITEYYFISALRVRSCSIEATPRTFPVR